MKKSLDISVLPNGTILWTRQDVEKALQVKKDCIYELINCGKLRIVKVGRFTRFLPSDIYKFIEDNMY